MELIQWSEKYEIGIEEIDNQHRGLIIIINELFELMSKGKAKDKLPEIFEHLTEYTKKHFSTEEIMMVKYAYPERDNHKNEHQKFIQKLTDLRKDFTNNKITISIEVLNFLKEWLLNHILISDKKYVGHIENFRKE